MARDAGTKLVDARSKTRGPVGRGGAVPVTKRGFSCHSYGWGCICMLIFMVIPVIPVSTARGREFVEVFGVASHK